MPDKGDVQRALINAHRAGDARAAERLSAMLGQQQEPGEPQRGRAFGRAALERFSDNLLGLPDLVATGAARTLAGQPLLPGRRVEGIPGMDLTPEQVERMNQPLVPVPELGQRVIPGIPRGADLLPGGEERSAELQEMHPGYSMAGSLAGDAATLVTGRAPGVRASASRANMPRTIDPRAGMMPRSKYRKPPPGVARQFDDLLKGPAMQRLGRASGRAMETGFEGATLALLQEGDPVDTAAWAAAGQLGGTAGLGLSRGLLSGGAGQAGLKLGMAALAAGSIVQLAKTATPGGDNWILPSIESGYDKVLYAISLGALSGIAGAGRIRSENLPVAMDAITAIPRGAMLGLIRDWNEASPAKRERMESVLTGLTHNPEHFGDEAAERLQAAFEGGDVAGVIDSLMDDRNFRDQLDALSREITEGEE